jgi:hypothetical protein
MIPRLESVYFPGSDQYPRLARVLRYTAQRWAPNWDIRVREVGPPEVTSPLRQSAADNSWKLEWWARAVEEAEDGQLLLLVDTDTFVAAPLDPLLDLTFDLAYTYRAASRFPLNGGVVAVRAGEGTRAAFREWLTEDRKMLRDPARLEPWRRFYGGQNQASFGACLEGGTFRNLRILPLPCREWNCEETGWAYYQEGRTRIVHVKAALRAHAFGLRSFPHTLELSTVWRRLEREAPGESSPTGIVSGL